MDAVEYHKYCDDEVRRRERVLVNTGYLRVWCLACGKYFHVSYFDNELLYCCVQHRERHRNFACGDMAEAVWQKDGA